jgi:hypothetical protein
MISLLFITIIVSLHIINVDGSHQFQSPSEKLMMIINEDANLGYINVRSSP